MLRIIFASILLAMTSVVSAQADSAALKKAAVAYIAYRVCDIDTSEMIYHLGRIGMIELGITPDQAAEIIRAYASKVVDHLVANNTAPEFCANASQARW